MISSAEPPETPTRHPGLTTARISAAIAKLEDIAPDLANDGHAELSAWTRRLSSGLYGLLNRTSGEHVIPPTPPNNPPKNTGV